MKEGGNEEKKSAKDGERGGEKEAFNCNLISKNSLNKR